MLRPFLQAKISSLVVTEKSIAYEGSLGVPGSVMEKGGLSPGQLVLVINLENGARFETYLIEEPEGISSLRGGAARLGEIGDRLLVMAFAWLGPGESSNPKVIKVDERNRVVETS
ncbi:aspartate 1-decarboxylase [candidate division WOR-3 bacterium]|nr:aspartate 1-decarboxylase [candidate division WOR-3 bacterium]